MLPDASDAVLHVAGDLHHPALLMSLSERSLVDLRRNSHIQTLQNFLHSCLLSSELEVTGIQPTSAITPTQPAMTAALAWAPLIPPRPEVTKTRPAKSPEPRYRRPAFSTVSYKEQPWFYDSVLSNLLLSADSNNI